ncbi:helix-turn-helix domain-containing protein [Virgibacillus xinjiangensis]|uniref:Helix-turn-helix domain-containing protein n=1 Tax=Virgibacillus xinjiangensis TaxID=393090 RepID=A0ABV7CZV9_9BACI
MLRERLKQRRKELKLTQEELAAKLHTTKATISNYESGYSNPPNKTLKELAKHLDTSTDYLLGVSTYSPSTGDMSVKEEPAFYEAISDPELKRWYKELPKSDEEDLRKLRKMWEIIKNEEK